MVCKLGNSRMEAMVRILSIGSFHEMTPEEAHYEKIVAQMIHREFCDADEANLLEEEDMHVFDSRPLKDPLNLVLCNACMKPVKDSQYASHSERCVPVSSENGDMGMDTNGGFKHRRSTNRWKQKLQVSNGQQDSSASDREKSVSTGATIASNVIPNRENNSGMQSRTSGGENYIPFPLATKMYYLQRNHDLRLALGRLYHKTYKERSGCVSGEDDSLAKKGEH